MRTRVVVGSLIGAVVIQGALIACRDVLILGDEDTGVHMADANGDMLDTAESMAVDAIDTVLDIPEARADGGVDGGPSCTCQPAPKPTATFSGSITQNGVNLIRGEYSFAQANHGRGLVDGVEKIQWNIAVRGFLTNGNSALVECRLSTTPQGSPLPGSSEYCRYSIGSPSGMSILDITNTNQQPSSASVTDTAATIGIPTVTQNGVTIALSVRITEPEGGITAIPNAYVP